MPEIRDMQRDIGHAADCGNLQLELNTITLQLE